MRTWSWLLNASLFLSISGASSLAQTPPPIITSAPLSEVALDVSLNGIPVGGALFLQRGEALFIAEEDLQRWRVRALIGEVIEHDGVRYRPLSAYSGTSTVDPTTLSAEITIDATMFPLTEFRVSQSTKPLPQQAGIGAFVNYSVTASASSQGMAWSTQTTGGLFGPAGVITTDVKAQGNRQSANVVRLETTFRREFPTTGERLQLGDNTTPSGAWGSSVRFGGVQWTFGNAHHPAVDSSPALDVEGLASRPSRVEVFVERSRIWLRDVPPGPFRFVNIPVSGSNGVARIVVTDDRGKQKEWSVPFARYEPLLRAGLMDNTVSAGLQREDFGVSSNSYGSAFGLVTSRWGVRDDLTVAGRLEVTSMHQAVGVSASTWWRGVGLLRGALGGSYAGGLWGAFAEADVSGNTGPWNYSSSVTWRTPGFTQLGGASPSLMKVQGSLGYSTGFSSIGLGASWSKSEDGNQISQLSASYQQPLSKTTALSLGASQSFGAVPSTRAFARLQMSLDPQKSASVEGSADGARVSLQHSKTPESPFSYQVSAEAGRQGASGHAGASWSTPVAELGATTHVTEKSFNGSVTASGAVGMLEGQLFAGRSEGGGYALVRVAGFPNVRVYLNNNLVGRTDAQGKLVVTGLKPLTKNWLSIEVADLPLQADLGETVIAAVPLPGNSVEVNFSVRKVHAAVLNLMLSDTEPVPAGAVVRVEGSAEDFPVAENGFTYVQGTTRKLTLTAFWEGKQCSAHIDFPESDDPMPELGRVKCEGG